MRTAVNEITDGRWAMRARHTAALTAAFLTWWVVGLFGAGAAQASAPLIVSAWAGTGVSATPVAGAATSSALGAPSGLALDGAGDLYVADATANVVERITPAGALTVVAGTGTAGPPQSGPATSSPLHDPTAVAVDSAGDLYIADTANHIVEKVDSAGTLTVIAGSGAAGPPVAGAATSSPLGGPDGLVLDGVGDLIIADGGGSNPNPYVESVSPTGVLSILAGDGVTGQPVAGPAAASPLRTPTGVAVDRSGNVFIADGHANQVLKVTPGGALSVYAGVSAGTAGAPTAGAATASRLNDPEGVATDAGGDLFIADTANSRVEEISTADRLSVIAGNGTSGAPAYGASPTHSPLSGPAGVAQTASGVTYIADAGHATVDRVAPTPPWAWSAPGISGTTAQNQTVTASTGSWADSPTAYAYAWERCTTAGAGCVTIPGATAASYTATAADVGATLRVIVTGSNPGGSATATSAASGVVQPLPPAVVAPPQIAGTPTNTDTLTVGTGSWTNHPGTFGYAWERCDASGAGCSKLAGATTAAYTLTAADIGATLRVIVTAANGGGSATVTTAASAAIAPATTPWVPAVAPAQRSPITVIGTPAPGQTLTCAPGDWSGSPSFTYQWNQGTVPIAGATAPTYAVTAADAGHPLACSVVATNAGGAIQADSGEVTATGPGPTAAGVSGSVPCPAPSGSLAGDRLGALTLGDTRGAVLRAVRRRAAGTGATDTFCLSGGPGLIVGYAAARSGSIARAARTGSAGHSGARSARRVELLLTANPYYALNDLRPGAGVSGAGGAAAATVGGTIRVHLGRPLRIRHTSWFIVAQRGATGLIAVRHGVIAEVGVTLRRASRATLRRLLARFSG